MWDLIVSVPDHCLSSYPIVEKKNTELAGRYSFAAHSLHMLVVLIILYGLEGLYLQYLCRWSRRGHILEKFAPRQVGLG